jgi:hypothetical protein
VTIARDALWKSKISGMGGGALVTAGVIECYQRRELSEHMQDADQINSLPRET